MPAWRVLHGDCLEIMGRMRAESVDAIVTDPPYGLVANKKGGSGVASVNLESPYGRARIGTGNGPGGFMGMAWDGAVPGVPFWTEALRVAKPGAHLLAFGGTRTFHRLAVAIEDAGWEVRDNIGWAHQKHLFCQCEALPHHGAPAHHGGARRSFAYADRSGAPPEPRPDGQHADEPRTLAVEWVAQGGGAWPCCGRCGEPLAPPLFQGPLAWNFGSGFPKSHNLSGAWEGWGTALKPAWEPIIVARKPLVGTVAANVLAHGTGALNIDGCRVASGEALVRPSIVRDDNAVLGKGLGAGTQVEPSGRWPANVILDEEAAAILDGQTGTLTSGKVTKTYEPTMEESVALGKKQRSLHPGAGFSDSGGASRFFYVAKASRSEREAGLREAEVQRYGEQGQGPDPKQTPRVVRPARNTHPTVKPVAVMRWLCRLVTPPGGIVLDPFCGSGTTGVAAVREGFRFVGIEREAEYVEIARARVAHASEET